jgi:UDP-galactopyranose mutase
MNIVCLSHLRWNFVFQRPQHLLRRAARDGTVLYIEEPMPAAGPASMAVQRDETGVLIAVPRLDEHATPAAQQQAHQRLVRAAIREHVGEHYVLWLYTPMALPLTPQLRPAAVVYDCMDELSAFAGADPDLPARERDLFRLADVVFTGGRSLFEAKREWHPNVHAFPSSVDVDHFAQARTRGVDPPDQAGIAHPRLGFFGVLDERMDYGLIADVARLRPDWQLVLVGPTAKIDPQDLPRAANLHYLGPQTYHDLPAYIAGWDVAMLPFAHNDATRFISPTKTPEYLAAGKPVVSTAIRDVVDPWGQRGLVRIADGAAAFVAAVDQALREDGDPRRRAADAVLAEMSWDRTWAGMARLIRAVMQPPPRRPRSTPVPLIRGSQLEA